LAVQEGVRVSPQAAKSDALAEFLSEFAACLLRQGLGISEFQAAAQAAFIQAALRSARLRNSRVNQSAVAAITGLSRAQVRGLLKRPPHSHSDSYGRIQRIVAGWRTDPEFLTSEGRPADLNSGNGRLSFSKLARKCSSDVSAPTLLKELIRMGHVVRVGRRLILAEVGPMAGAGQDVVRSLSAGFAHVISAMADESPKSVHVFTASAQYLAPDGVSAVLMRKRLAQGVRAFAMDIKTAGDALGTRKALRSDARLAKTKILVVSSS
jgi:hypothetical protein